MDDLLEQTLTSRLREIGESVPDEVEPPADLELRVARQRKRARTSSRSAFVLAVAAVVLVAIGTATVIRIATPAPRIAAKVPAHDPLPVGTVMLSAHGLDVVALDARGRQLATMVHAARGAIVDVQITRDHRSLWYLSVAPNAGTPCGEVVRADLLTRSSTIIAHAVAFAISPDARRVALAGYGDVAHGSCIAGLEPGLAVIDLWNNARVNEPTPAAMHALRWSPDGKQLFVQNCNLAGCRVGQRERIDDVHLRAAPGSQLVNSPTFALAPDGMYAVDPAGRTISVYAPGSTARTASMTTGAVRVEQVVPTTAGLFVVGRAGTGAAELYAIAPTGPVPTNDHSPGAIAAVPVFTLTPPAS